MSNSSKQQERSEGEQNAPEIAGIYNENSSTTQTNQTGSTLSQVADQTASSLSRDVDSRVTSGAEATGQASCSSEPARDSPCNEVKTTQRGKKKYKVRYEMNNSLLRRSVIFIVPCLFEVQLIPKRFHPLMKSTSFSNYFSEKIILIDKIPAFLWVFKVES